jgi:hypothetical protein
MGEAMESGTRRLAYVAILLAITGSDANARVVRVAFDKTEPGTSAIGATEAFTGRAFGELDPHAAGNVIITDIDHAPVNARGMVEYVAKFTLTKPLDMAKASGVLWYDLVNRGAPVPLNRGDADPLDSGHVRLISGWQGDITPTASNWTVEVPVAHNADGSSITGPVLSRTADVQQGTPSRPLGVLSYPNPYDAASLDTSRFRLLAIGSETRVGVVGVSTEVASGDWAFADCSKQSFPGTPNPRMLCVRDGFDPAKLYQLTYEAKDPKVLGVGLAAMRDVADFFRYSSSDDAGTPNPVAGRITHAVAQGISQSGNALKTFLLLGFNADESGRIVFDGANPHIGGRLTAVNVRFGVPSGSGTLYEPGGEGVLWWTPYTDAVRGRQQASLLDRCMATHSCPKIFETFGSTEFNARLMGIALTGTDGRADLPLPGNVRRYFIAGTTHNGDAQGGFAFAPKPAPGCVLPRNPNSEAETMNALRAALVAWVKDSTEPPPSAYPRLADGDLVADTREAMSFPVIPGTLSPTGLAVGLADYDYGPELRANDFSGVLTRQPPAIRQVIPPLMPKVGDDGNEYQGIRTVLHQSPLGTYTGWNAVAAGFFKGQPCGGGLVGGYIPFARTRAERMQAGDPRPSLQERYGTHEGYLCSARSAIAHNVAARFLGSVDAKRLESEAETTDAFDGLSVTEAERTIAQHVCTATD